MKKAGISANTGLAKIWKTNPMLMKVSATPAKADSKAARGVLRRTQPPTKDPAISMRADPRQAKRPAFQARSARWVSRKTGPIIRKTWAKRLTVLMP